MHYYLYQITNLVNNKIYVGVHKTKNLDDGYMGSGKVIKRAIEKHGIDNFVKVILETFENAEAMYAREKEVVTEEFLAREDVYNLRRGGHGGFEYINKNGLAANKEHSILGAKATSLKYANLTEKEKVVLKEERSNRIKNIHATGSLRKAYFGKCGWQRKAIEASKSPQSISKRKKTFKQIEHQKGSNNSQAKRVVDDEGNEFNTLNECAAFHGFKRSGSVAYRIKLGKYKLLPQNSSYRG